MSSQLSFVRDVIYSLKMEYGEPLTIGILLPGTANLLTGQKNDQFVEHKIRRAIRLPNSISFDYLRAVGIIPQQKGMSIPVGSFSILIDRKDLPDNRVPTPSKSFATCGPRRFDIVKVDDYQYAYILWVKELLGSTIPSNVQTSITTISNSVT